jgi:hypothetical protein
LYYYFEYRFAVLSFLLLFFDPSFPNSLEMQLRICKLQYTSMHLLPNYTLHVVFLFLFSYSSEGGTRYEGSCLPDIGPTNTVLETVADMWVAIFVKCGTFPATPSSCSEWFGWRLVEVGPVPNFSCFPRSRPKSRLVF